MLFADNVCHHIILICPAQANLQHDIERVHYKTTSIPGREKPFVVDFPPRKAAPPTPARRRCM